MCALHKMRIDDQGGYTLLEGILHLAVFMLFAQVLVGTMWWLTTTEASVTDTTDTEWALFIQYLDSYLTEIDSIQVQENSKGITINKDKVNYKVDYYNGIVRKQKNLDGHEQMLLNVESLFIEMEGNSLKLHVNFLNGAGREHVFYVTYRTE